MVSAPRRSVGNSTFAATAACSHSARLPADFSTSADRFPFDDASRFNFTFDFSGGVQIVNSNRRSFTIGYKYQHISNGYTGTFNPGVDVQMVFAGFSIFR
ncbi:MAG TPA: acyloxyacyl hydrolase [Pyrinomonadaceae bacterium]